MLHTTNPEILFLKQEDVVKAGLLDMKQIIEVTEKTYSMPARARSRTRPRRIPASPTRRTGSRSSTPCPATSAATCISPA